MSFDNSSVFICSLDNTQLIDIYDPLYDEDDYMKMPDYMDQLSLSEQETLRSRHQTLVEILSNLSSEKRDRCMNLINEKDALILVCPTCKKVYDSKNLFERDLYHSSNNMLPIRKQKQHKVISDDRESIENAMQQNKIDSHFYAKQVFLPQLTPEEEEKKYRIDNRTPFKMKEDSKSADKIKHARDHISALIDKFGKENVNVQINFPDENN